MSLSTFKSKVQRLTENIAHDIGEVLGRIDYENLAVLDNPKLRVSKMAENAKEVEGLVGGRLDDWNREAGQNSGIEDGAPAEAERPDKLDLGRGSAAQLQASLTRISQLAESLAKASEKSPANEMMHERLAGDLEQIYEWARELKKDWGSRLSA